MRRDLELISGRFFDYELPKDKRWMLHYFKTDLQRAFLRYYLIFENWKCFRDHTGLSCSPRLLDRFERRFHKISEIYSQAKSSLTEKSMEAVYLIETGQYRLTRRKRT